MTSPYLERPVRSYRDAAQDISRRRDYQPDLKFYGDELAWGEHDAIATGHTIRRETRRLVESMKRQGKLLVGTWPRDREIWDGRDLAWLRKARKAHSKAILDREAYKQAIREREIQRTLFKGANE